MRQPVEVRGVSGNLTAWVCHCLQQQPDIENHLADFDLTALHSNSQHCYIPVGDTPGHLVLRWGGDTLKHFLSIFNSPAGATAGTQLISGYQLWQVVVIVVPRCDANTSLLALCLAFAPQQDLCTTKCSTNGCRNMKLTQFGRTCHLASAI